jgi:hypothetical protein
MTRALAVTAVLFGTIVASPAAGARQVAPACDLADLTVRPILMSSPTGLAQRGLRFVERASQPCALEGFPVISLHDRGGAIQFSYRYHGRRPSRVLLTRTGAAYVVVSKFRCDMGTRRVAQFGQVSLRGGSSARIRFSLHVGIGLCRPGIPGEGRTVTVTPFRRTAREAIKDSLSG